MATEELRVVKRFTEDQIRRILRETETAGLSIREICRRHNVTEPTFFRWRIKYGATEVSDARRLKALEAENTKLKHLLAEQLLLIERLKRKKSVRAKIPAASEVE